MSLRIRFRCREREKGQGLGRWVQELEGGQVQRDVVRSQREVIFKDKGLRVKEMEQVQVQEEGLEKRGLELEREDYERKGGLEIDGVTNQREELGVREGDRLIV